MKGIGSVKENLDTEKRISITPETVKKLAKLNFTVFIEKNYGNHLIKMIRSLWHCIQF